MHQSELKWSLIGRFFTDRSINITVMKQTLASIWRPVKEVVIRDVAPNLFIF